MDVALALLLGLVVGGIVGFVFALKVTVDSWVEHIEKMYKEGVITKPVADDLLNLRHRKMESGR